MLPWNAIDEVYHRQMKEKKVNYRIVSRKKRRKKKKKLYGFMSCNQRLHNEDLTFFFFFNFQKIEHQCLAPPRYKWLRCRTFSVIRRLTTGMQTDNDEMGDTWTYNFSFSLSLSFEPEKMSTEKESERAREREICVSVFLLVRRENFYLTSVERERKMISLDGSTEQRRLAQNKPLFLLPVPSADLITIVWKLSDE